MDAMGNKRREPVLAARLKPFHYMLA